MYRKMCNKWVYVHQSLSHVYETQKNLSQKISQTSSSRVHLDLSHKYLFHWLAFHNHDKWRLLGFPRHAFLLISDDAFVWTLSNCVRSMLAIRASLRSSRQLLLLDIIYGFCPASLFMQIMARVVSFSLFRRGIARNTQLFWKRSRIDVFISFLLIFLMNSLAMKWCLCWKILQFFACTACLCKSLSGQLPL